MYKKIQLTLCGLAMSGIWCNFLYHAHHFNLNKKEENEVIELYKDIVI